MPTGLPSFDNDQGGLFPGELTILAARPGCGKTSLALQIAQYNGERGRLVYLASLEMSAAELSTRMACGDAGVSSRLVRTGQLTSEQAAALSEAFARQGTRWPHPEDDELYNRLCIGFSIGCIAPVGIYPGRVILHLDGGAWIGSKTGVGFYENFATTSVTLVVQSGKIPCITSAYGPYQWGSWSGFNSDATWSIF